MITSFRVFESEFEELLYSLYDDNSIVGENLKFTEAIERAGQEYFKSKKILVMLDDYSNFIDWISEWNEMHPEQAINQDEVYHYDEEQVMEQMQDVVIDAMTAFKSLETGNLTILKEWLETKPSVDDFIGNELPICLAVIHAKDDKTAYDAITELMEHFVDINAKDKTGKTVLHYACNGLLLKTIELLLDYEANVQTGNSPIPYLAVVGLAYSQSSDKSQDEKVKQIIKLLMEDGASFDEKMKDGRSIAEYFTSLNLGHLLMP